mmetsp:Transcript_57066/g.79152  ORF Transcript_57066/g.79152 Transcript_57066/m.79152 type:complete len:200 (-) Transcript_57066:46-645(-)
MATFDGLRSDLQRLDANSRLSERAGRARPELASSSVAEGSAGGVRAASSEPRTVQAGAAADGTGAPARIPAGGFYISPNLTFDSRAATVIFQIRDAESGDVTRQFPPETVVERYRRDPTERPFVLPEPAAEARTEELEPRINNREPADPAEIELATGPSPEPVGSDAASGGIGVAAPPASETLGGPSISRQLAPVDIVA